MSKIFDFFSVVGDLIIRAVMFIGQLYEIVKNGIPIILTLMSSAPILLQVFFSLFVSFSIALFVWRLIPWQKYFLLFLEDSLTATAFWKDLFFPLIWVCTVFLLVCGISFVLCSFFPALFLLLFLLIHPVDLLTVYQVFLKNQNVMILITRLSIKSR